MQIKHFKLAADRRPFLVVGHGRLHACYAAIAGIVDQATVDLNEMPLIGRNILVTDDGSYRALGNADGAVDTFVRVNDQKIGTFKKAVHGAHTDAVGVFALDACFGNYKCHEYACWGIQAFYDTTMTES